MNALVFCSDLDSLGFNRGGEKVRFCSGGEGEGGGGDEMVDKIKSWDVILGSCREK